MNENEFIYIYNTIHMYSGITSGRVLNGELLYTKILEVNANANKLTSRILCIYIYYIYNWFCWQLQGLRVLNKNGAGYKTYMMER